MDEKYQIILAPGQEKAELIIREVSTVNELPVKPPKKLQITGTLGCVAEFLSKRVDQPDQINQKRCHICIDRAAMSISLTTNERDEYNSIIVTGVLDFNPKFDEFGINTGKEWTPIKLGLFLKMNRAFFSDKNENMRLVTELMNFIATVNNKIERSANEKGDRSDNFQQVVSSNLPGKFTICIQLIKGMPAEIIEVETFAHIVGREVSFTLISPAAQEIIDTIKDRVIDEQIELIRSIAPDIAILEL